MDRLGTFSLAKSKTPEYIGPSQPNKSGKVDGDRLGTFSMAKSKQSDSTAAAIGPSQPNKVDGSCLSVVETMVLLDFGGMERFEYGEGKSTSRDATINSKYIS